MREDKCPVCGCELIGLSIENRSVYSLGCADCGHEGPRGRNMDEAVCLWNMDARLMEFKTVNTQQQIGVPKHGK